MALVACCLLGPGLRAQDGPGRMAEGIAAMKALDPRGAADAFETILAGDSLQVEANWRAALALIDIGKQVREADRNPTRDSLYRLAERYARRGVTLAPDSAATHFALALALGRSALTKGKKERIRSALEIRNEARRALDLNPDHDGAWHVLGRWHAEIERLSNLEEFFARKFLGGEVFGEASFAEAVRCMERAVELRGDFIYHRLDLAEVYVELKRWDDARAQLRVVPGLPAQDVMDHVYRARADVLLHKIRNKL
ncbi:MAG TPA: tetratricopeptide repeat protein [Gemmatimonadales bacterium]